MRRAQARELLVQKAAEVSRGACSAYGSKP
jgi:hypothetical protein